jgi:low affinity Fe/Cu permease
MRTSLIINVILKIAELATMIHLMTTIQIIQNLVVNINVKLTKDIANTDIQNIKQKREKDVKDVKQKREENVKQKKGNNKNLK